MNTQEGLALEETDQLGVINAHRVKNCCNVWQGNYEIQCEGKLGFWSSALPQPWPLHCQAEHFREFALETMNRVQKKLKACIVGSLRMMERIKAPGNKQQR